jgi:hypothetical protein
MNTMDRASRNFVPERQPSWPLPLRAPRINLTLTQGEAGRLKVDVGITEFIAYSQNPAFTRLNLTGGKVLDVKETTDQIDRLVRAASGQSNFAVSSLSS